MSQYKSIALFLDNPGSIEIYHEFARNGNHDLLHLAKNPQNINELPTKKYDLIIVEISHPSMTEIEFIDSLHTICENIPIIVVSSYFYDTREIVFGNKIRGFIQNPLTVQKLEAQAALYLIQETQRLSQK